MALAGGGRANDRDPWACGYAIERGMAYTGSNVGAQANNFLKPIYSAREAIATAGGNVSNFFNSHLNDGGEVVESEKPTASDGLASLVNWLGRLAGRIEHGNFRIYIIYVVIALVLFLALAVGMR